MLKPGRRKALVLVVWTLLSLAAAQQHLNADFSTQCKNAVIDRYEAVKNGSLPDKELPFLVGQDGPSAGAVSLADAWGLSVDNCTEICGSIGIPFQFSNFSAAMTNWLLPWVILTAQLPYETSGPFNNVLSVLLAVGSPAFVTFGLVLTMSNRFRVAESFQNLYALARDDKVKAAYPRLMDRLHEARYLVSESQQAPMRAYDGQGWLSSLLLYDANFHWWTNVKKDLSNTRRKATISLIVQILFAFLAWLFTVIVAFDNLGDVVTALSISTSSIWLWEVPVVSGWVAVGTQVRKNAIADALQGHANRAEIPGDEENEALEAVRDAQNGITNRSGINPFFTAAIRRSTVVRTQTGGASIPQGLADDPRGSIALGPMLSRLNTADTEQTVGLLEPDFDEQSLPSRFSFALTGDESKEGPIYNYARVFTFSRFSATIEHGFLTALKKIHQGRIEARPNLSSFCGFTAPIAAYPEWHEIDAKVWRSIFVASIVALFVQWGTSGPSIMLDYLTPVAGLGCRSGSHLIYAVLATLSWILLFAASLLSHGIMLRHQAKPDRSPGGGLAMLFIFCRLSGIFLASANAIWLLLSSVFELSGVYDTCWCNADYLSYHDRGWLLLFKGAEQLGPSVQGYWVGAVVWVSIVCFLASGFVWLGCKKD